MGRIADNHINNDALTAKYFESESAEERYLEEKWKAEELKKEQERKKAEEESKRAEEAERKRIEAEKARKEEEARNKQRQRKKEEALLKERKRILFENEQAVINGQSSYNGRNLCNSDYINLARNSTNERVINILIRSKDKNVLEALLKNSSVTQKMRSRIIGRQCDLEDIEENGGCLHCLGKFIGIGGTILFFSAIIAMIIFVISSFF